MSMRASRTNAIHKGTFFLPHLSWRGFSCHEPWNLLTKKSHQSAGHKLPKFLPDNHIEGFSSERYSQVA
jgi:hypothetical protein